MRIYTKTVDDVTSSLINSKRIKKCDIIFDVLGSLDELSCRIGLAKAADSEKIFYFLLEEVQKTLMKLSILSTDSSVRQFPLFSASL